MSRTETSTRAAADPRSPAIATERQPNCPLCGTPGRDRFHDLQDRLFEAPGVWSMKECPTCGALWLDPRPTPKSVGQAYETYYTHAPRFGVAAIYDAAVRRIARERAAKAFGFGRPTPLLSQASDLLLKIYPSLADQTDLLIRHLPARPRGARLVDIGCGHGEALSFLASLGWSATGVEVDPKAVRAARDRGLDVVQGDIHSAAIETGSLDAVTSSHVIEHLHDPLAFLSEAHRVLKPGGVVVAVTPNSRSELLQRHGANWLALDPPRHLILFNADNIARLAVQAGFREVRVKGTARLLGYDHIASVSIARTGRAVLGDRLDFRTWLESKRLEARVKDQLKRGQAEGEELVLIAQK